MPSRFAPTKIFHGWQVDVSAAEALQQGAFFFFGGGGLVVIALLQRCNHRIWDWYAHVLLTIFRVRDWWDLKNSGDFPTSWCRHEFVQRYQFFCLYTCIQLAWQDSTIFSTHLKNICFHCLHGTVLSNGQDMSFVALFGWYETISKSNGNFLHTPGMPWELVQNPWEFLKKKRPSRFTKVEIFILRWQRGGLWTMVFGSSGPGNFVGLPCQSGATCGLKMFEVLHCICYHFCSGHVLKHWRLCSIAFFCESLSNLGNHETAKQQKAFIQCWVYLDASAGTSWIATLVPSKNTDGWCGCHATSRGRWQW